MICPLSMNEPENIPAVNHAEPPALPAEPRILCSEELFAGQKTIVIRHGAEDYRLLITRNDRLILQK
jgi:hemin uptake protein HemP